MGRVHTVALVLKIATHDAVAGHITVHEWTRCPRWLTPVDLLEIAESNFGGSTPVPLTMHPDERFVDLHFPTFAPHEVNTTAMSASHPVQGGELIVLSEPLKGLNAVSGSIPPVNRRVAGSSSAVATAPSWYRPVVVASRDRRLLLTGLR